MTFHLTDRPLSDMSVELQDHFIGGLDVQNPPRNWHTIGLRLAVPPRHLELLRLAYQRPGGSPTADLFDILIARENQPAIRDLANLLVDIGRHDVVAGWNWEQNPGLREIAVA